MDLDHRATTIKFLIRDGAGQFTGSFDAVFTAQGIRILASPPDPVNLAEHWIRRKQVLGGLTREYYIAALPSSFATGERRAPPESYSEPHRRAGRGEAAKLR
jgi:hypothetical protein